MAIIHIWWENWTCTSGNIFLTSFKMLKIRNYKSLLLWFYFKTKWYPKFNLNYIKFGFSKLTRVIFARIFVEAHSERSKKSWKSAKRERVATSRSSRNSIQHPNGCRTACRKQRNALNNSAIVHRTDYSPGLSRSCIFPGSFLHV